MVTVEIDGEYGDEDGGGVHISDEHGEIVMWDSQEWIDEPSLVFVIASAIREVYENGPGSLRARVGNPATPVAKEACDMRIVCLDKHVRPLTLAALTCGRDYQHKGWHVSVDSSHRWNDTGQYHGRIEHI